MNIMQIRNFLEVSKTLNFTLAAHNLYVAQSSLSRQIQSLEEEIGIKLLQRDRRHVVLTKAGELFQKEYSKIMLDMDDALEKVKNADSKRKEIKIGLFQAISAYEFLEEMINLMHLNLPDYKISIRLLKFYELQNAYKNDQIDLSIVTDNLTKYFVDSEKVVVGEEEQGIVFTNRMIRSSNKLSIKSFQRKKLVCIDDTIVPGVYKEQLQLLIEAGIMPSEVIQTGDLLNIILYTEPSEGIALLGKSAFKEKEHKIEYFPLEGDKYSIKINALWKNTTCIPFGKCLKTVYYD